MFLVSYLPWCEVDRIHFGSYTSIEAATKEAAAFLTQYTLCEEDEGHYPALYIERPA